MFKSLFINKFVGNKRKKQSTKSTWSQWTSERKAIHDKKAARLKTDWKHQKSNVFVVIKDRWAALNRDSIIKMKKR